MFAETFGRFNDFEKSLVQHAAAHKVIQKLLKVELDDVLEEISNLDLTQNDQSLANIIRTLAAKKDIYAELIEFLDDVVLNIDSLNNEQMEPKDVDS